jgi:hypothetical protein
MSEPWFDPATFGALYGGIVGGGGGTVGGLLGALAGVLAPQGKGRPLVLGGMWAFVAFGLANLGLGVYALYDGQPYGIWFGLLMGGLVFTIVMGGLIPVVRLRYRQAEGRHLQAENFRGS